MLDLNTIFGTREQLLPQEGFWGFLLDNWLTVAIVMMILGFVIDQVLYIVRYRPQDKFIRLRRAVERLFIKNADDALLMDDERENAQEAFAEEENHVVREEKPAAQNAMSNKVDDAPVIRRGGAKYAPKPMEEEPVYTAPKRPQAVVQDDEDAPMVVRAPARPQRSRSEEPDTRRGVQ